MSDTQSSAREPAAFTSSRRKELFLEMAGRPVGTTPAEVHRAAAEQGDTATEEAYYNIARRLLHRGILATEPSDVATRYTLGAPAQSRWLEQDDLSALIDPEYPLLAITIWKESERQINEVTEHLWVELRERLRSQPAPALFHQAIRSYSEDFLAQVALLADPGNFPAAKGLAEARQEARNAHRLLLQLTKYGLGLSQEAVNLPVNLDAAVADYQRGRRGPLVNGEILRQELSRRIAPEPFLVDVPAAPPGRPLLIGAVDGSTRGGLLSFLGEEGDFNVGHAPMIVLNTAVGQVNRDLQVEGRAVPAFLRLPEKPEDMQRQDNRYTVMAKLLYPDMSDAQYIHSVCNAMDLVEAKVALRLLRRWYVPRPGTEIGAADVVLRDGPVSPEARDPRFYQEMSSYGQIVRDLIETNWELARKCHEDGQTLAGVVKTAQLSVFAPVVNWFACHVAREGAGAGASQIASWPLQTMNLIPDQVLLTRLLTAGRNKAAPWTRTCVTLRPFHALSWLARVYTRKASASMSLLNDYNEARERLDELDQERRYFWEALFRGENDPYVKMLDNVFYGNFFLGAVPRLDNEKNLPRLEFLVPAATAERDGPPWDSASRHRDRLIQALRQNGFDVAAEHTLFGSRAKLDVLPALLIKVHDTVKHWAAELLSRVQEYVGYHLARYVKTKRIRGVRVRPFQREELEMLYAQLRQEREFQAGAPERPNLREDGPGPLGSGS
jgi:hypothetical protein